MKKFISIISLVVIVGLLSWAMVAFSEYLEVPNSPGQGSGKLEGTYTLLSAVTATGDGTAVDMGFTVSQFTVLTTWGGTAPTNIATALKGSIDNSSYIVLTANTMTASPNMYFTTAKPVRYIKGNYGSKSGGDGTTSLTMKCTAGGN